jgi:hypothetical protein
LSVYYFDIIMISNVIRIFHFRKFFFHYRLKQKIAPFTLVVAGQDKAVRPGNNIMISSQ